MAGMFGSLQPCGVNGINFNSPNMGFYNPEVPVYGGKSSNKSRYKANNATRKTKISCSYLNGHTSGFDPSTLKLE